MPCYPALALLLGSAMAAEGDWVRRGTRVLCVILAAWRHRCGHAVFLARNLPAPGDISSALSPNPGAYTLSLGHMEDLTLASFAYLRPPLLAAAIAFLIGAIGTVARRRTARVSRRRGDGRAVFSSCADGLGGVRSRICLRGRWPTLCCERRKGNWSSIIITTRFRRFSSTPIATRCCSTGGSIIWCTAPMRPARRIFLSTISNGKPCGWTRSAATWWRAVPRFPALEDLVGRDRLNVVAESGGKLLLANQPLASSSLKR